MNSLLNLKILKHVSTHLNWFFFSEINNSIISIHKSFISYDNFFIYLFFLVSIKNNGINA